MGGIDRALNCDICERETKSKKARSRQHSAPELMDKFCTAWYGVGSMPASP